MKSSLSVNLRTRLYSTCIISRTDPFPGWLMQKELKTLFCLALNVGSKSSRGSKVFKNQGSFCYLQDSLKLSKLSTAAMSGCSRSGCTRFKVLDLIDERFSVVWSELVWFRSVGARSIWTPLIRTQSKPTRHDKNDACFRMLTYWLLASSI